MKRLLLILAALLTLPAFAADAYFVRFRASGKSDTAGTRALLWADDILFYNTTASPQEVRFVGVSNGAAPSNPPALTLPPGRAISLGATDIEQNERWSPFGRPALWILHLDVPAGVVAESRDEFYAPYNSSAFIPPPARGKVSMPIFDRLTPANTPQIHLGTDLSGQQSRTNVGVYNAGSETAIATIELRRACDNSLTDSRTIAVPPNTVVQTGNLSAGSRPTVAGCPEGLSTPLEMYTIVTASQPSLSYVSNVNDTIEPAPGEFGWVPIVGVAVTKNHPF